MILGREPGNIVWWELEQLARLTGWPLVGIDDLAERDGRVVLREDGSPVDVVWRRTNEDRLRGDDGRLTALGALLLEPLRRGAVRVLNAFGTGVADDKRTYVYVERLVRFYCGEEPLLRSVPAWDLADDEQRAEALERLDELVFKPRDGAGGDGHRARPAAPRTRSCRSCAPRSRPTRAPGSPRSRSRCRRTRRSSTAASSRATSTCGRSSSAGACCRAA